MCTESESSLVWKLPSNLACMEIGERRAKFYRAALYAMVDFHLGEATLLKGFLIDELSSASLLL